MAVERKKQTKRDKLMSNPSQNFRAEICTGNGIYLHKINIFNTPRWVTLAQNITLNFIYSPMLMWKKNRCPR